MVSHSAAAIYLAIAASALMAHAMPTNDISLVSAPAVVGGSSDVVRASGQPPMASAITGAAITGAANGGASNGGGAHHAANDDTGRRDADRRTRSRRHAPGRGYDNDDGASDCSSEDGRRSDASSCSESCSDDDDDDDNRRRSRRDSCESTDRRHSTRRHGQYRSHHSSSHWSVRNGRYRQDRWSGDDADCDDAGFDGYADVDHSYGGVSPYSQDYDGYGGRPYGSGVSPYEAGGAYDGGDSYGADNYADNRYDGGDDYSGGGYQGHVGGHYQGGDDYQGGGQYGGYDDYRTNGGHAPVRGGRHQPMARTHQYSQDDYAAHASQDSVTIADRRQGRISASQRHADEESLHQSGQDRVMVDQYGQRATSHQEELDAARRSADASQVHVRGPHGSLDQSVRDASDATINADENDRTFNGPNRHATEHSVDVSTTSHNAHSVETDIRGNPSFGQ